MMQEISDYAAVLNDQIMLYMHLIVQDKSLVDFQ